MRKNSKWLPILFGLLGLYLLGYAYARMFVFHTVERYLGAEGKGDPRRDYIAKKDRPAGEGWEYQLFLPVIKAEEGIVNYVHESNKIAIYKVLKFRVKLEHSLRWQAIQLVQIIY